MRSHAVQTSFLTGVIDPRAKARVDTESYNNALLEGENIVLSHLGGVRRRGGLGYLASLPGPLTKAVTGIVPTAPHGGSPYNALSSNSALLVTTTDTIGTTDPYVIVHYDANATLTVRFADVVDILTSGGTSTQFCIQYSTDNTTWVTMGAAFSAVDYQDRRTYRREGPATARYWRVAKIGGADLGSATVSISGFHLWIEDAEPPSGVRVFPWEVSTEERYAVVVTSHTASIFRDREFVQSVALPYESADIPALDASSDAETLVIVHEDYPPRFLLRESLDNIQTQEIEFTSVPEYDFGDALSPAETPCIQEITLTGTWTGGETFQLELDGARTGSIAYAGYGTAARQATTNANVVRALQKLYTVPSFTGVSAEAVSTSVIKVTFAGGSAKAYGVITLVPLGGAGTAAIIKTQEGVARSEPVWSSTRGYPRTVTWFGGRLFFGGTKSRQQTIFGSVVNDPLSLRPGEGLADEPVLVTLAGQQLNAVNGLFAGRSLEVFTTGAEFRFAKQAGDPVVPGDAPAYQTGNGGARIRPVSLDGSTLFVQRNRKSVRDFKFNYEQDAYDSLGVSSLAPHLLSDIDHLFVWQGSRVDEAGLCFVINGDGTVAVFNSRKEANVQAWVRWTTQGYFRAGTALLEDVYFVVERTLNGVQVNCFEYLSSDLYLDCSLRQAGASMTTVPGLAHLNGIECRVRADAFVLSNVTPVGGTAVIERESSDVEVGLGFSPRVTPMPFNTMQPSGSPNFMRRRRVVKAHAKVKDTLGLRINGRVIPDRAFDVDLFDAPAQPFSGNVAIEETSNWDDKFDKTVTFDQVDPLPFQILGVDVQLEGSE